MTGCVRAHPVYMRDLFGDLLDLAMTCLGLLLFCVTRRKRQMPGTAKEGTQRCAVCQMASVQVLLLSVGCLVTAIHDWFVGASVSALVHDVRGDAWPPLLSPCNTQRCTMYADPMTLVKAPPLMTGTSPLRRVCAALRVVQ